VCCRLKGRGVAWRWRRRLWESEEELLRECRIVILFTCVFGKQYGMVLIITSRIKLEILGHVVHSSSS